MNNVVIIPCFNRPEFLALTCENIIKAKKSEQFIYLFSLDKGGDPMCEEVFKQFPYEKVLVKRKPTTYKLGKQSYNVLSAYAEACHLSDKYVILIEDDIFVHNDFFDWHLQVHSQERDAFCSIATFNHNTTYDVTDDVSAYYFGSVTDYQSWGVCWKKDVLINYILPHACQTYFLYPEKYVTTVFNQSWIGKHYCEQDGLIRRVRVECSGMPVIFPHVPRAFHAGFYSYHRNEYTRFQGSIEERKEKIKYILADPERYRQNCENDAFYNDSKAIDLTTKFEYEKQILMNIKTK